MDKWHRTGTLNRNANDTGDANSNCDTRVVTTSKCDDRTTIDVEESSSSKRNTVGNIWNWGLFSEVMRVNRPHMCFVL
jgi:hypothetical protein